MPLINNKLKELQAVIDSIWSQLNRSEIDASTAIREIALVLSKLVSFITRLDNKIRERQ